MTGVSGLKSLVKSLLTQSRRHSMRLQMSSSIYLSPKGAPPRIFNLDLHTALVGDLKSGLGNFNVEFVNWSLSGNNRNTRKFFKIPDPVFRLSDKSWLEYTEEDFEMVASHYSKFFATFDGFICTFPPAFMQIFEKFNKPILIYSGTRYEAPFTNNADSWNSLNSRIESNIKSGKLVYATNNQADKDYIEYFSEIKPHLVPSLCDYTRLEWNPRPGINIVFAKSNELISDISRLTGKNWKGAREVLGKNYSYGDLAKVARILVIPYNISTMSLFEFAAAGIEVLVPSKNFLHRLFDQYDGVLSELSFYQIQKLNVDLLTADNPNNYKSRHFFDWWVDRSDFYNSELMPNIKLIDSFDDLLFEYPSDIKNLYPQTEARNAKLRKSRQKLLENFLKIL